MDADSWCLVCSRLVEPKRTTVIVNPPQPRTPAPPPTSPQSSPSKKDTNSSKRKPAPRRGGLVQGTGRMKPNGTIKGPDSTKSKHPSQISSKPIRYRTIIDQGPLPLYCSEECEKLDNKSSAGSVGTTTSGSSSIPSESSISTASSAAYEQGPLPQTADQPQYASASVAVLAKLYNFPPPPPPAPAPCEDPVPCRAPLADNGLIMAGRYLRELCSPPAKPRTSRYSPPPEPPKTVAGWNDGSHAWRACLYNQTSPSPSRLSQKRIVSSRLGDASMPLRPTECPPSENLAIMNKYTESLARRAESRTPPSRDAVPMRERSILPPGLEGKLLVPNVKLKVRTGSSTSVASKSISPVALGSESGEDDSASKCDSTISGPQPPRRPVPEARSWSYDNFKTYDLMPLPAQKEKRTQISIVDGKEVRIEHEVEVQQSPKRLFLFPPSVRAS